MLVNHHYGEVAGAVYTADSTVKSSSKLARMRPGGSTAISAEGGTEIMSVNHDNAEVAAAVYTADSTVKSSSKLARMRPLGSTAIS